MRSLFLLLVLCLSASSTAAATGTGSGNDLLEQCNTAIRFSDNGKLGEATASEAFRIGFCLGLVHGAVETIRAQQIGFGHTEFGCIPDAIENGQAARIVVKYLKEHPDQLHQDDALLAISALRQAYPCSKPVGR